MNLLIISHTPHYHQGKQLVGWGPTIREIDQLATLFDHVYHLAVLYDHQPPLSSLPYSASNVSFIPVRPAGGETLDAKIDVIRAYFGYWKRIGRAIQELHENDVVHVRCPANISLLAVLYLIVKHNVSRRWIKYAGNWKPNGREPFTYLLQRWLLEHNFARSVVTINGRWRGQPRHIRSFYNPSLSAGDLPQALRDIQAKRLSTPLQLLYVGRVETPKGCGRLIEIARALSGRHVDFNLHIIGDGQERSRFELMTEEMGLANQTCFYGWMSPLELAQFYKKAHFMILPTLSSEGWPKVLSEAMAYGVVPLAGRISSIPQMLEVCKTGLALDPLDTPAFVNAIMYYVNNPDRWQQESLAGHQSAYRFTYEEYVLQLREMYAEEWGMRI